MGLFINFVLLLLLWFGIVGSLPLPKVLKIVTNHVFSV
jgi:hypothetical protein